jgi:hypothetical protein
MIYLFDANVLITANNLYYPIHQFPQYWDWVAYQANLGNIKIPLEIFEEMKDGPDDGVKDPLFAWLHQAENKEALVLDELLQPKLVRKVVSSGYASDLTDDELEQLGRDPLLIAYALADENRCVVTVESSKPAKKRQNRKIPDVCKSLGVKCATPFDVSRELGFSTNWKDSLKD